MKWSGEYTVNANDVDFNNIVSVSNMLRYMQDAANYEMEEDGLSYNELFSRGLSFVLSRIRMSFYSPIYAHEKIEVQSWACESRGVQFNRCYRIIRNGVIAAEAVSVWALVGVNDRHLHRVNEFDLPYRKDEMLELDMPARFKIPDDVDMRLVSERVVEYADVDMNLIPVAKYFIDPAGHYSTPGNMQLYVDASPQKPVSILDEEPPHGLTYAEIHRDEAAETE